MAPIIRILLRYMTFPFLYFGLISEHEASDLIRDPEIVQYMSLGLGVVAPFLAEGWYWAARKLGWTT